MSQLSLKDFEESSEQLTDAERECWQAIEKGPYGPREWARKTDRSPGTISNLLRRARAKKGETE